MHDEVNSHGGLKTLQPPQFHIQTLGMLVENAFNVHDKSCAWRGLRVEFNFRQPLNAGMDLIRLEPISKFPTAVDPL